MTVYKKNVKPFIPSVGSKSKYMQLKSDTKLQISELLDRDPLTDAEEQISIIKECNKNSNVHLPFSFGDSRSRTRVTVPPLVQVTPEFKAIRENLPIYQYRNDISTAIKTNQVVVISGETGSGNFWFFLSK